MTNKPITGDEPYYPVIIPDTVYTYEPDLGVTIRQKFIADYIIKNRSGHIECDALLAEAELTFKSYLKLINEPQP